MAHHSIIIKPKGNQKLPSEIVLKAKDLYYLFRDWVTWRISEERIMLYCDCAFFDFSEELREELEQNHISKNMIDVYKWICANANVTSDCWNPCDFEYGPNSVNEFEEDVQDAVKKAKSWDGPITEIEQTGLKLLIMRYNQEMNRICMDFRGKQLEVMLPDGVQRVDDAIVRKNDELVVGTFSKVIKIDLVYEIYQERYVASDIDRMYIFDVVNEIQEALKEGVLVQGFIS